MADGSPEKENDNSKDTDSYIKYDAKDIQYFGAQGVIEKEFEYIRRRRGLAGDADIKGLTGLALSGGGIRSASFSLGVMQALAHNGWLKNFDYLSTVSGGGYIGSSVSWLLSQPMVPSETGIKRFSLDRKSFPYGTYPMGGSDPELRLSAKADKAHTANDEGTSGVTERYKGKLLRYLRQQAKYLTPGDGINTMSLVAVILRGAMISLSVYFGLFLALFLVAAYPLLAYTPASLGLPFRADNLALWLGLVSGGLFIALSLIYSVTTNALSKRKRDTDDSEKSSAYHWRQRYERTASTLLTLTLALLILGAVPTVYEALQELGAGAAVETSDFQISGSRSANGALQFSGSLEAPMTGDESNNPVLAGWIGALSTLFGVLSGIFAFFKTSSGKKGRIPMGMVVTIATATLWFGLLLLAYHIAVRLSADASGSSIIVLIGGIALVVAALAGLLGRVANINYLAIHRYYRDRLMELFMPDVDKALGGAIATRAAASADKMPIHALFAANEGEGPSANPAPYHLINTNVVLESSNIPKFRGRGGDNFILSPYYCGSNATGWSKSDVFMEGRMTLPTAMAISGAAVNPGAGVGGQGVTRQPLLSMLMGLLNIRLGYWAPNPNKHHGTKSIPNYLHPGLSEVFFRSRLNEEANYVQLTDGGHFENLALYELIRRRTKLIVLCDGGADPDFQFTDFANTVEKVRTDFGTLILCDCEDLQPLVPRSKAGADITDDAIKYAEHGYIMRTIIYPDNSQGRLLYLKTTFFEQLSTDLYGYKKAHPQFPDEPTSDQFFDEKQFEAYRELGFQTAWQMMQDDNVRDDAFVRLLWANH